MKKRSLPALVLSLIALAACQPGGELDAELEPILGMPVPEIPADQALATMCAGDPALQTQMIEAVNAARGAEGKVLLNPNEKLNEMAQSHACDAAAMGKATVTGSNGSNVVDRARAVGFPTCGVAQLIAAGNTPTEVVNFWLHSMPHRVELLGQSSDDIGVGVIRVPGGRTWWSVVLGDDCS